MSDVTTLKWTKNLSLCGKIPCIHRLEEIILSKCGYYPKESTDSMQFLWKSQW